MSLFGEDGVGSSQTATKDKGMATVTQVQEATNAEGQSIKLAVAYDDKVHSEVCNHCFVSCLRAIFIKPIVEICSLSSRVRHYDQVHTNRVVRL